MPDFVHLFRRLSTGSFLRRTAGPLILFAFCSVAFGQLEFRGGTIPGNQLFGDGAVVIISDEITNNGTVTLEANADVRVDRETSVNGNGSFDLKSSNVFLRGSGAANDILTNGAEHRIHGFGRVGIGSLGIVNEGVINANANRQRLSLEMGSSVLVNDQGANLANRGVMQATDGGTLLLAGGLYDNSSGTITSDSQSKVILNAGGVVGGRFGGNFETSDGGVFSLGGEITNEASYRVTANGDVRIDGEALFSGAGDFTLRNPNAFLRGSGSINDILTNGANHRIQGFGRVGIGSLGIVNEGVIDASTNRERLSLEMESSVLVNDQGANLANHGVLQATNGGTLVLAGGTYDNTMGVISSDSNSKVLLAAGNVEGGSFDGNFETSDGGVFALRGNIANESSYSITANGDVRIDGETVFRGAGDFTLKSTGAFLRGSGSDGDILTNGTEHRIQGYGRVGLGSLGVVNEGVIDASTAKQQLRLEMGSNVFVTDQGANLANHGLMQASNGGTLLLAGGMYDNTMGIISSDQQSKVVLSAGLVTGGQFAGNIETSDGGIVSLSGDIVNDATYNITANGDVRIQGSTSFTGSGNVTLKSPNVFLRGSGTSNDILTNGAEHGIFGFGLVGRNLGLAIVNHGTINANASGKSLSLELSDDIDLGPNNANLLNSGLLAATDNGILDIRARISGSGVIHADGGIVRFSGNSSGTELGLLKATNNGRFELGSGSRFQGSRLEIANGSSISVLGELELTEGLLYETTKAADWNWGPASKLTLSGGAHANPSDFSAWTILEVGGSDVGPVVSGFNSSNLYIPELVIGSGANVYLADTFDNRVGDAPEAIYVGQLVFMDESARLNLNGLNLYFQSLVGAESQFLDLDVILRGDFDGNSVVSSADIDLLAESIRNGSADERLDLNQDGSYDALDLNAWVVEIARTSLGDADLDRSVQFSDFVSLANNFGTAGGWAAGDFDGDGFVQFSDFVILANNFGVTRNSVNAVPEPASALGYFATITMLAMCRRRSRDGAALIVVRQLLRRMPHDDVADLHRSN